ncbi:MAG: prepilin-type N-terminal cleavage/methylation domain-containing protein [Phycisphaerales bacterium]|nr:prepilin-type N-terminal cleavage/methylation domain-containing protein [Phycisphaerales bacterium]
MQRRRRLFRGFTVTEILVVIAILAILLALVIVGYRRVTVMARTSSCLSNQRQISLAQTSYASDNGGALASPCTSFRGMSGSFNLSSACGEIPVVLNNGNLTNTSYHSWTSSYPGTDDAGDPMMSPRGENAGALTKGRLFSYLGSVPVYKSPLDPTDRLRSYSLNCFVGVTLPNDVANYGKAWVDWFCAQGVSPRDWVTTHIARIKDPSHTMMSIVEEDRAGNGASAGFNNHGFVIDPRPPSGSVAPTGTPNPANWASPAWQGWIDTPAMWQPGAITTSNIDGSTESYSFQNSAASAIIADMQRAGNSHGFNQPADEGPAGAWRRDWMHFRDRLLPGVIPPMIPRYQR